MIVLFVVDNGALTVRGAESRRKRNLEKLGMLHLCVAAQTIGVRAKFPLILETIVI